MRGLNTSSDMPAMRQHPASRLAAIGLIVISCWSACGAQHRAMNFSGVGGIGTTVSVASLRIPEKAWRHLAKAASLVQQNRLIEADLESQKAITIAPDFAIAQLLRASVQVREGDFLAATVSVAEARRAKPDLQWSGVILASAYNGLQRYVEAQTALNALTGAEAVSWQASYERARSAIGLEDASGALHWSEAALAGAPAEFTDAMIVRANSLVLAGHWSDAAAQLEAYLQTDLSTHRRSEVLAALDGDRRLAHEEELRHLASRE